jgi:multiple sugar transport system permease protein
MPSRRLTLTLAADDVADRRPKRSRPRDRPLWMLVPAGVVVGLIVVVPIAITVVLSVLRLNVSTLHLWLRAPFDGIQNYVSAFTTPSIIGVSLGRSIELSVKFSVLTTVVATPIGMLGAFSVHRPFRGRGLVRALYLIPYVIPTFVTALVARIMFRNQTGVVDRVLSDLGLAGRNTFWLIGPHAFWAMLATEVWASWPFIYLMVLSGLQAVPLELFEAAALDGATYLQKLRHVVLPQLSGVLKIAIVLSTLYHFGNFTLAYVMFSSPPPSSVALLPLNAYYNAFSSFDFGVASAIAVVTIAVLLVPAWAYLRITRVSTLDPMGS